MTFHLNCTKYWKIVVNSALRRFLMLTIANEDYAYGKKVMLAFLLILLLLINSFIKILISLLLHFGFKT